MSCIILIGFILTTAMILVILQWLVDNFRWRNGMDSYRVGVLPTVFLQLWIVLALAAAGMLNAFLFRYDFEKGILWTGAAMFIVSLLPLSLQIKDFIVYFFSVGGLPRSFSSKVRICKNCSRRIYSDFYLSHCRSCGSESLIFCYTRWQFDWRKPSTWLRPWLYYPLPKEHSGLGIAGKWYGTDCPQGYEFGSWLGQEGVELPRKYQHSVQSAPFVASAQRQW